MQDREYDPNIDNYDSNKYNDIPHHIENNPHPIRDNYDEYGMEFERLESENYYVNNYNNDNYDVFDSNYVEGYYDENDEFQEIDERYYFEPHYENPINEDIGHYNLKKYGGNQTVINRSNYSPKKEEKPQSTLRKIAVGVLVTIVLLFAFGTGITMGFFNNGLINDLGEPSVSFTASINDSAFPIESPVVNTTNHTRSNYTSSNSSYQSNYSQSSSYNSSGSGYSSGGSSSSGESGSSNYNSGSSSGSGGSSSSSQ